MMNRLLNAIQYNLEYIVPLLKRKGIIKGMKEYAKKKKRYCNNGEKDNPTTNNINMIARLVKIGGISGLFLNELIIEINPKGINIIYAAITSISNPSLAPYDFAALCSA